MSESPNDILRYLLQDDAALLADCKVDTYKASGPGGQHRNKVSSAVRLTHQPTGTTAHGNDSRSQHENKALAVKRLRMNLATTHRQPVDVQSPPPQAIRDCLFIPKKGRADKARLDIGRKDVRFWAVAACMLDALDTCSGRLAEAAQWMGISTSNFATMAKKDRHFLAEVQAIRRKHELGPIS